MLRHETSFSIYQQAVDCSNGKFRKETKFFFGKNPSFWARRIDVKVFSMLVVETMEWKSSPWEKWRSA